MFALLTGAAIALPLATAPLSGAQAQSSAQPPAWRPQVTEKLVKLPNDYVKRALDKDFAGSPLSGALSDVKSEIGLKLQTLADLQGASEQADGELKTELEHQFLAEKKAYLDLVGEQQLLKQRHLQTRVRVYERMLKRTGRANSGQTPAQAKLVEKQVAAKARFEKTQASIDVTLFEQSVAQESKYAKEYSKNLSAIKQLVAAIENHPVTQQTVADQAGQIDRPEFLRQLIADTEADLALVKQEQEIVGFMAKLVSLDAQALAERVSVDVIDIDGEAPEEGLTAAIDFFVQ